MTIDGSLAGKGYESKCTGEKSRKERKRGKQVKFGGREVSVDPEETSNLATIYKTEEQVVKVC